MDENTTIPAVVLSDEIKEAYLKVYGNGGYETILSKIDNTNILKIVDSVDSVALAVGAGIITKAQAEILKEYNTELQELYPNVEGHGGDVNVSGSDGGSDAK